MKTLSLKLPEALARQLAALAKKRSTNKSVLVREALENYLRYKNGKKKVSFLDVVGDLIGCFDGPGDLSYNKKYMEGYGRE